jgi:hypothetical protein
MAWGVDFQAWGRDSRTLCTGSGRLDIEVLSFFVHGTRFGKLCGHDKVSHYREQGQQQLQKSGFRLNTVHAVYGCAVASSEKNPGAIFPRKQRPHEFSHGRAKRKKTQARHARRRSLAG